MRVMILSPCFKSFCYPFLAFSISGIDLKLGSYLYVFSDGCEIIKALSQDIIDHWVL